VQGSGSPCVKRQPLYCDSSGLASIYLCDLRIEQMCPMKALDAREDARLDLPSRRSLQKPVNRGAGI
jgi:hypothetical protein